jgi:hypothetical protein
MRPFDSSESKEAPVAAGDRHGVPDINEENREEGATTADEKTEADGENSI